MNQIPVTIVQEHKLPIVSKIIDRGTHSFVGILRDHPTCVLKRPRQNEDTLKSEKRALALLGQHPYIVQLQRTSESGLCFEYHPFRSLRHYYAESGPPSLDQRYRWYHQAVSGFAYIHSKNLIHHDISARNVLLSSDLTIKICDFGSATQLGEEIHGLAEFRYSFGRVSREWKATFMYDLFCMGALFYEIIVGKPPFDDLNRAEVVERFKQQTLPSLDAIEHTYATIIANCWNDKYSSFQELEADLPSQVQEYHNGLSESTILS